MHNCLRAQEFITGYGKSAWNLSDKEVVHVTNLDNTGPGSLRDAVSRSNRIVIFDVGGVIEISSAINIDSSNIIVAAFTAPGQFGIVTKGRRGMRIRGDNVAVVGLKIWIDSFAGVADGIQASGNNILVAHGSTLFATDESLATFGNSSSTTIDAKNITFFKMIAVGANTRHQASGGMMNSKGVGNVDFIQCVAAFNQIRSFLFASEVQGATQFGNQFNCVVYNWLNSAVELRGPANVNIIGNFFKKGPSNTIKEGITSVDGILYVGDNNTNNLSRNSDGFELLNEPINIPYQYNFKSADDVYEELIIDRQVGWKNTRLENTILDHIENGTDHPGGFDGVTDITQFGGWPEVPSTSTTHVFSDINSYLKSFFDEVITDVNEPPGFNLTAYPNPTNSDLTLESNFPTNLQYQIIDMMGHEIIKSSFFQQKTVDLSNLLSGMYFVKFSDKKRSPTVLKIIKL